MTEYDNQHEVHAALSAYISHYQTERKHSALGYRSPQQYERRTSTERLNI